MRIENYREFNEASPQLALFDIYLPEISLTLANLRIVKSKKGTHFIGYPSYSEEREDGKKEWKPFFSFSQEKKREFEDKVFELLKDYSGFVLLRWAPSSR